KPLKSPAEVDILLWKQCKRPVRLLDVLHEHVISYLHEAAAIAIWVAFSTELRIMRSTEIVEHLRIRATRLSGRHIFGYARSTPPILFRVVVKNASSLHSETVSIGLGTKYDFLSFDPALGKELLPDSAGFFITRHVVLLVTGERGHID